MDGVVSMPENGRSSNDRYIILNRDKAGFCIIYKNLGADKNIFADVDPSPTMQSSSPRRQKWKISCHAMQNSLDSETLRTQLSKTGVSKVVDLVERTITHRSDRFAEPEASATDVETGWRHVLALHERQDSLERSLKAAEEAWYRDCTPEAEARLLDIKRQLAQAAALEHFENTEHIDAQPADEPAKRAS